MAELEDVVSAVNNVNDSVKELNENLILINDTVVLMNENDVLYHEGVGLFIIGLNERLDALELKYDDNVALYTGEEQKEINIKYYEQLEDLKAMNTYNFVFMGVIVAALIVLIISGILKRA